MRYSIIFLSYLIIFLSFYNLKGQQVDSVRNISLNEVTVLANKLPVLLKRNPGSISLVNEDVLLKLPKEIGVEEALRLVPGVRIDNQHNGERVHLSIRGQGILTERGLRGIGVMIDGIPINDPSGFAPDLYDVDWSLVKSIEVLRGSAAGLYGGSSSGGVINIFTKNGGENPLGGHLCQIFGSNGFMKSLLQIDGSNDKVDYRASFSRSRGDGYRDHQAFWSNKFNEKINFHTGRKLSISQTIMHTDYFQQNPEGLNLSQFDNLRQANPDACPFNEYQKTNRTTIGLTGKYIFNEKNDVEAASYLRNWNYKETSNKCAEYRNINNPGVNIQYNLHFSNGKIRNHLSLGGDYKYQKIKMYKLQSEANPDRQESIKQDNIENDSLLANQIIFQENKALFALYKMEISKFTLLGSVRYDNMYNNLSNKMLRSDTAASSKSFEKTSLRIGASYEIAEPLSFFVNCSSGFIPPSTEELASNPAGYSGFNTNLVPAISNSFDLGIRGFISNKINFEVTGFVMNTENDFFRFKQSGRGNQEVFYGNAGNSKRYGLETFISYKIFKNFSLQLSYTFADYKYTSSSINPVYTDTAFVLTIPPSDGQRLPNSPQHQIYAETDYFITKDIRISLGMEYQSKWAIYTDAKAYNGELDSSIYQNWQDGFSLFHCRISYTWEISGIKGECSLFARNFTGKKYMAFTEPDPDGNSYQPGPARELFGSLKIRF